MADKNFKVKTGLTLPSPLPVDQGGTGQTSASNTLNALLPLQTSNANKVLQTDGTNTSWITPSVAYTRGTTSQRPASPTAGDLFFNTEKKAFEVWTGSAWVSVAVNGAVPLPPTIGTASLTALIASVPFTGPNDFGDAAISTYTATSNPGSISVSSATSPISITGLTAGTAYTFTVTATNAFGISNASSASNSVTTANVPGAPTSVTAADTGIDGEALIAWTAPGSNGGSAITDYIVEYSLNAGSSYTVFADGTSTATSATVTGLTIGTTYIFRVKAVNVIGTGTASSSSSSYTPVAHFSTSFYSISTTNVGAGGQGSLTISSIPQTYTHLQLRLFGRLTDVVSSGDALIRFNGDTAGNYSHHHWYATGSSNSASSPSPSASSTTMWSSYGGFPGTNKGTSWWGYHVIDITNYTSTSIAKVIKGLGGYSKLETSTTSSQETSMTSGQWNSTAAINSITISGVNWAQYSSIALYGWS